MRYPLPYAFARTSQLLIEDDGQEPVLWHSPSPNWQAISEVQRKHAVQRWQALDAGALAHRDDAAGTYRMAMGHGAQLQRSAQTRFGQP